jgi:hypothetical protein
MTEINPPGFLQNSGTTNTAEILREVANVLTGGGISSNAQRAKGGVHPGLGSQFNVQQAGAPNMTVDVLAGHALIAGSEAAKQAVYSCFNDATVNKAIAASDPSLPRIDIVVAKVQDTQYSGAVNSWSLAVVTGTPAGSPAVPTAPNNSIILAQVAVAAGVTSIVNANISDKRIYLAATGAIVPVNDKATRDAIASPHDGLAVWRRDLKVLNVFNATASNWRWFSRPTNAVIATQQTTTSTAYVDLATVGPTVTLETGDAVKVTITALAFNSGANLNWVGIAVSGASTVAAADTRALNHVGVAGLRYSFTTLLTGLTPGTNVFTAKYRTSAGTASYQDREIVIEPC